MPRYPATKPVIVKNVTEVGDISKTYGFLTRIPDDTVGLGLITYILTSDESIDYGGDIIKRFKGKTLIRRTIHLKISVLEEVLNKIFLGEKK